MRTIAQGSHRASAGFSANGLRGGDENHQSSRVVGASSKNAMKRFLTESGVIVPAVTAAEMREIDRIALEQTGPNPFQVRRPRTPPGCSASTQPRSRGLLSQTRASVSLKYAK